MYLMLVHVCLEADIDFKRFRLMRIISTDYIKIVWWPFSFLYLIKLQTSKYPCIHDISTTYILTSAGDADVINPPSLTLPLDIPFLSPVKF